MNLAKLRQELVQDEGIRLSAYQDTVGLWTIGIGHLLGPVKRMSDITIQETLLLFDADIEIARNLALNLVPILSIIGDARSRALVNMSFNLGSRLGQFTMFLKSVNNSQWALAGIQMMQSKWATQVGQRAVRLQQMIITGKDI